MRVSGSLIELLPLPQRLAAAYAPPRARAANMALLALDARLAAVLRGRREPLATQLRLAWWRETLETPASEWPAGEPVLEALAGWRNPAGLAVLPAGWEALLAEDLTPAVVAEFVDARAQAFGCLAVELGVERPETAREAGQLWALADLAANMSHGAERQMVVNYGRTLPPPGRLSASLRPLAVLAALAQASLERNGTPLLDGPRSALLALRVGLSGR